MNIELEVAGKGSGYLSRLEVFPNEYLSVLAKKVKFYKMFAGRGFQVFSNTHEKFLDWDYMNETQFKDSGLKNGDKLTMKEAPRQRTNSEGEIIGLDDDEELEMEFEEGMIGEGGEDELVDMDEEGELEMDEDELKEAPAQEADAAEGGNPEEEKAAEDQP